MCSLGAVQDFRQILQLGHSASLHWMGSPSWLARLPIAAAAPRAIGRFERKKQIASAAFFCILEDRMYT